MEPSPATFQLKSFSIPTFSFEEPKSPAISIDISLQPAGTFNTSNGEYILHIIFSAIASESKNTEQPKPFIEAVIKGIFIIDKIDKETPIPDFFYQNSLAIIFPYLRGFVSTMTLQAGIPLVVLPLLNLTSFANTLKENTSFFE